MEHTFLLSTIGLKGVGAWAELAALPIINSLNAFADAVNNKALSRQILLYTRAREVGCTFGDIINRQMCTEIEYDDTGWIFSVNIRGDRIEQCDHINTCIGPSPLMPVEVFEYAEFLFNRTKNISELNEDLITIKKIMEERIELCK